MDHCSDRCMIQVEAEWIKGVYHLILLVQELLALDTCVDGVKATTVFEMLDFAVQSRL